MPNNDVTAKTIETYEQIAEKYAGEPDTNIKPEYADFFFKHLKGKKVLDVGCGAGHESKFFSDKGLDVTGIDLTPNFVEMSARRVPKAKFLKMDMRKLDFPDESFDGVWASKAILHVPKAEAKATLIGFHRVLKPGGLLYVSVKEGSGERFVEEQGRERFFAFYVADELKKLVESAGFHVEKIEVVHPVNKNWINVFAVK